MIENGRGRGWLDTDGGRGRTLILMVESDRGREWLDTYDREWQMQKQRMVRY
jgi:hypothetical protein